MLSDGCLLTILVFLCRFFLKEPYPYRKKAPWEVCRLEKPENPSAAELRQLVDSLYREQFKKLVEKARRSGCSLDYAEDIVQEVFQIAVEKSADLYASENRIGWLVNTLRNRIGQNFRAMQYAQRLKAEMEKLHSDRYEDHLDPKDIYHGLVSDEDLDILVRFYVEGRPIQSIADHYDIKYETCKKRLQRAKARFFLNYKDLIEGI